MTTSIASRINATGSLTARQKDLLRDMSAMNPKIVFLETNAVVNTTTTVATVSGLSFPIAKDKRYIFEVFLKTTCNATDGIKVAALCAGAASVGYAVWSYTLDNASVQQDVQDDLTDTSTGINGVGAAVTAIRANGYVTSTTTDSVVYIQSALAVDNNAVSTIEAGSYIKIYEIA